MAIEGHVKFEYFSKSVKPFYNTQSLPEILDDENIVFKTNNLEMNIHQYFNFFKKFLLSVGFCDQNIISGACNLAFNETNNEDLMKKVAEEYDIVLGEDLPSIINERLEIEKKYTTIDYDKKIEELEKTCKIWEERYNTLYKNLKKHTENIQYTDEEMDAMCDHAASEEERDKCREYNLREAEYYNKRVELDAEHSKKSFDVFEDNSNKDMWDQGMMKVSTNNPTRAWNGLIPGSPEARAAGCICPVLDNEEMPDDKKWIDVECPLHGRSK